MMTSRQRLIETLNHRQPDQVCVDFGATAVTGMHVSALTRLRRAVLGEPGHRAKVIEPYQMLGEFDEPLREALGIDVLPLPSTRRRRAPGHDRRRSRKRLAQLLHRREAMRAHFRHIRWRRAIMGKALWRMVASGRRSALWRRPRGSFSRNSLHRPAQGL